MTSRLLLLASLFSSSVILRAQAIYTVPAGREPVHVGNKFLYLRDTARTLTLAEALKSRDWQPVKNEIPNFDVTKDVIWGKISLTCTETGDWYLGLQPSSFNRIMFFQKRGAEQWTETSMGNTVPLSAKKLPLNEIMVNLDLRPGDTTILMFRLQDYYPMQLDFSIGKADSFLGFLQDLNMYNGLCYGVMLMMLIYNFYLFFTQKERIYIYYVLYIFGNGIFTMVFNGNYMYLPGFLKPVVLFDPIIFPAAFGVFLTLFTIELFRGFLPGSFVKMLYAFMAVVSFDVVLAPIDIHIAFDAIRILGLLLGIVSLAAGVIAYRKGSPSAMFFLIGFGAYLGSLIYIILSGPLLPITSFNLKAVVTGGAIESVFLSFAQGDKLKFLQVEKEKAQHEALVQVQKNETLIREQNLVLEHKVRERTAELAEKNKEVTDSIHYAKRIQGTLLADQELLHKYIPDHFIIFKPKDIVSGDFYWAAYRENQQNASDSGTFYLAVCDSTGHGVPGAFMSLLNISFLNEAVAEKDIATPSEAFDYVRTHLINSISRDGGRDGMDGILLAMTTEKNTDTISCSYTASNNNPVLISGNEIILLPADKMPVGQWENMSSFTLNKRTLKKGDMLYLFTDGFADQFGGPEGKKFKNKQLKDKLLAVSQKPLAEQKKELEDTFEIWKGGLEQVDDVCVIGIRV
jgi:serine phosphatase RsbU (regulator of sigma subunit)